MYDFPASPTEGQEFHPPGGPVYVFSTPRWLIQGGTSGGSGGSGDAAWDEITGKPATFPPTLPIAQSGVTNLTTDLAAKAPLASPGLTGTPTAPTAAPGTNTTQLASTAFVKAAVDADITPWAEITGKPATFPPTVPIAQADVTGLVAALAAKAPINDPVLTGNARAPTAVTGDNTTQIATTAHVKANLATYAPLASPSFTGDPKAPTPSLFDNDTSIATTSFVQNVVSAVLAGTAPLASPTFTGNPTAPTPTPGDNDTSIATTAFVKYAVDSNVEDWSTITGKPATFSPTLPIAQSGVTDLVTDLAAKAPLASPALTGIPTAPAPTPGVVSLQIATTEYVQESIEPKLDDAPIDGLVYARQDGAWVEAAGGGGGAATAVADTAPVAPTQGQLWFDSSTANLYLWYDDGTSGQWVQVNSAVAV